MMTDPKKVTLAEIPALVAEKVMGWERDGYLWRDSEGITAWAKDNPSGGPGKAWDPTTDARAWIEVWEHVAQPGGRVHVHLRDEIGLPPDFPRRWRCEVYTHLGTFTSRQQPSPGLAVCLAALAACEYPVELVEEKP